MAFGAFGGAALGDSKMPVLRIWTKAKETSPLLVSSTQHHHRSDRDHRPGVTVWYVAHEVRRSKDDSKYYCLLSLMPREKQCNTDMQNATCRSHSRLIPAGD
jgi:hypothetical protein